MEGSHQQTMRSTRLTDLKKRKTNNSVSVSVNQNDKKNQQKKSKKIEPSNVEKDYNNDINVTPGKSDSLKDSSITKEQQLSNIASRISSYKPKEDEEDDDKSLQEVERGIQIDNVNMYDTSSECKDTTVGTTTTQRVILGGGHFSMLHTFVRDDLFKRIKILSPHHLETNSKILQTCLNQVKYNEKINGNKLNFMQACKAEIRKTMCSRRGYVKRQIGLLITGKTLF